MRRVAALLLFSLAAACGSGTDEGGPPKSPFNVAVISDNPTGCTPPGTGACVHTVVFEVTDKATSDPVLGASVIVQVSRPDSVSPIPATAANGRTTATWVIPATDQTPGVPHALAFCAPPLGSSICQTKFTDPGTLIEDFQ